MEAFSSPTYNPSMAASFIGCLWATLKAASSPVTATKMEAMKPKTAATTMLRLAIFWCRSCKRKRAEMPTTKSEASRKAELVVWVNLCTATGERATSQKFCISKRALSGLKAMPTGNCIQPLATRIQTADRLEPTATIQVEKR